MSSKAIPSHLRKPASGDGDDAGAAEFARKHHGKTQSHVVSLSIPVPPLVPTVCPCLFTLQTTVRQLA